MKSRTTSSKLPYLKMWRMFRMLTGSDLCRMTGLANSTVCGLERRDRTATRETIEKLAKALTVTPDQLIETWPQGMKPTEEK